MAQLIIAISREYGSGGHEIATKVAEHFNLPMYDRNMLDAWAEKNGLEAEELHKHDETKKRGLTRTVRGFSSSVADHVADLQFDFIKEKAEEGESFIIVGRCAEHILKGYPGLVTIFVRGDRPTKIERIKELYKLNEVEAKIKIDRHDKKRKAYHNAHCDMKWGDSRAYDMCINSSKLGIDKTVEAICDFIDEFKSVIETA